MFANVAASGLTNQEQEEIADVWPLHFAGAIE